MGAAQPDTQLLDNALAGDPDAFAALCEKSRERVWRVVASVAHGAEAEDLAQEAVVRAYAARRSYRAAAPFEAWLCRIAVNVAHDFQRSAWRRRVTLCEESADRNVAAATEDVAQEREAQREVRRAVAQLPPRQRVPIWLHYFEGFPIAAIAALEAASESTVRSRMRAGLRRLALALDDLLGPATDGVLPLRPDTKGCEA